MLESSLWDRHGSAASYRQEQPIESPQEAYTHQSRTASDRHYVLESVGPPASFSQRRLSISHSAGCSSLESTNLVQALPSVASASRISPQSASPPMMMHRPPTHGGEHTFILDHSMVRDNGLKPPMRNLPPIPPIRTKWSKGSSRDCPPLSLQSNSSYSTSRSGDSKMSPSTPRSSLIPSTSTLGDSYLGYDMPKQAYNVLIDHPSHMGNFVSESPVDFRRPFRDDHDMEHCSEQDDVREREDDDEDDDEDEDENLRTRKVARHHLANDNKIKAVTGSTSRQINDEEEEDTEEGNSTYASSSGSRKPSLANSPLRDMTKAPKKSARGKPTQAALDEAIAEYDEETGAQSLNGKGLGFYAPLVCARLAARGVTTYNDLVNDLAGSQPVERIEGGSTQERNGQGNIRRRVYDALNILQSLGIISMDKKAIEWIGIENSIPIGDLSRKIHPSGSNSFQHQERDGADESEEPEDDEMDIGIEQLQKDVESMRLRNELEMARLQDQIARGVRLNNLVERNKHKEEKELERQARRQKKKLDRKEEKRAQAAAGESMELGEESGDVGGEQKKRSEKRHHRHHRHRSPRAENEDQEEDDTDQNGDKLGEDVDEETARRIRKQERKEKRERKERRAQKRQEKEARKHEERIQMPFVVVRIPGYGGQSSDSEASISVVRRVREEPRSRKSGKSKKHADETTMVEIKMPHNEELNIISDTEIVGDLGLNDVPLSDLRAMLPQDVIDRAGYATTTTSGAHGDNIIASVQGGFERALVCSVGN
ncbi:Transcription factor Dp-2 [Mortierella sp. AM989]|nr:Transcription factor Dp-2 [Mortierella sp. AM989]